MTALPQPLVVPDFRGIVALSLSVVSNAAQVAPATRHGDLQLKIN